MYVNKCIKCGREFETKNPKRVICPECLYPDKNMMVSSSPSESVNEPTNLGTTPEQVAEERPKFYSSYSAGEGREVAPQRDYNKPNYNRGGGQRPYNNRQGGGFNRGGQRPHGNHQGGGFNRYSNNQQRPGGFNRNRFGNNQRPQQRRPMRPKAPKQLLVNKEQLEQIELLYKQMLPLPNPDCHEVIGAQMGLEPRKVFFGINLVRQKLMLPKLPFPKRKLAISPDQLFAIKNLYEPLLPLPPIGCHKIIAAQLRMDEWRVHVGIGLVRSQMGLERWNPDRDDAPEEFKKAKQEAEQEAEKTEKTEKPKRTRRTKKTSETTEEE